MTRGDDQTPPGTPRDTDPGVEPAQAPPLLARDLYNPPILNPKVAALLKGLNASRVPHPTPKVVATTDGELKAHWAAEAREVSAPYPTPEPVPNVLLNCTEEPIRAPFGQHGAHGLRPAPSRIVDPRGLHQMLIETDPGPDEDGARPKPGLETVMLPARRIRRMRRVVAGLVVGLAAALGVAAWIGHRQQERTRLATAQLRIPSHTQPTSAPVESEVPAAPAVAAMPLAPAAGQAADASAGDRVPVTPVTRPSDSERAATKLAATGPRSTAPSTTPRRALPPPSATSEEAAETPPPPSQNFKQNALRSRQPPSL